MHDAGNRNALALAVAHVELPDFVDVGAVFALGLHVDLPLQAEAVEVVDHRATHKSAERIVGIVDRDTFDEGFVAIDGEFDLRDGGEEGRVDVLQLGAFGCRGHEGLGLLGEELDRAAGAVLQDEVHAARGADAGNGGRRKSEGHGGRKRGQLGVHPAHDVVVLRLRCGALVPRLERDEEKCVVGRVDLAEQVEADGGSHVFHAGCVHEDLLDLRGHHAGALHRGRVGQLQGGVEIALILFGQEGRGETAAEEKCGRRQDSEEAEAEDEFADGRAANAHVVVRGLAEHVVEPLVESAERSAGLAFRAQDERGDGRTEGQGVESGQADGDRDGHGELLVEAAGDAGDEDRGDEDRGKDKGDGHDRTGDFLHGLERGIARAHSLLDMVLDGFDHHDGVVDDETDGQHQAEERERVDGKSEQRENGEGADERDGNGEERNERGAPPLQEDEDDDNDEKKGLEEGFDDFLDAGGDGERGVERLGVLHAGRKALGQLGHELLRLAGRVERVAARRLVEGDDGGRLALEAALDIVILRAEFDARHVFEAEDGAVCIGPHHDLAEFLDRGEITLADHGVGEFLTGRDRFGPDFANGIDAVLLLDRVDDFLRGDVELGQLVGCDPNAHGILAGTEDGDVGDAGETRQFVVQVDVRVVGEEEGIESVVGGIEREEKERCRRALLHGGAEFDDGCWQLRIGLRLPHLREDLVVGRVGVDAEEDVEGHAAVVGIDRIHVFHALDAVDLLLDRRSYRLLDGQRVRADIGRIHLDLRRDDVRVLRDGQARHGDKADDDRDDGNDHRHDRTVDEKLRHGRVRLRASGRRGGSFGQRGGRGCRGRRNDRFRGRGRTLERGLRRLDHVIAVRRRRLRRGQAGIGVETRGHLP